MAISSSQFGNLPGLGTAIETFESAVGFSRREQAVITNFTIDGASRDSGNTSNTAVLRPGLLMGLVTSTGLLKQYDPTATDGTENALGVLLVSVRMTDILSGSNQNKGYGVLVGGPVQASAIIGLDNKARANMNNRFIFDDDFLGNSFGWKEVFAQATSYSVVAADNNKIFSTRGASGAVTYTLPALAAASRGFRVKFVAEAAQNMIVTAVAANTMVAYNNLTATSVAFQTGGAIIGGAVEIYANDNVTKWISQIYLASASQTVTVA